LNNWLNFDTKSIWKKLWLY